MSSRSLIHEKTLDLLALESRTSELYKEALEYPESVRYRETLTAIMNDELKHIKLAKEILQIIESL